MAYGGLLWSSGQNAYFGMWGLQFDSQVSNKVANEIFVADVVWFFVQAGHNYNTYSIIY